MTLVVMSLDMIHVYGLMDAGHLVQSSRVRPHVWKIGEPLQVAFEMTDINRIESNQGGKQPPIRLGERRTR